jgi:hypothetical protein
MEIEEHTIIRADGTKEYVLAVVDHFDENPVRRTVYLDPPILYNGDVLCTSKSSST